MRISRTHVRNADMISDIAAADVRSAVETFCERRIRTGAPMGRKLRVLWMRFCLKSLDNLQRKVIVWELSKDSKLV